MARLTRQPKEVETARGERLSPEKSLVKEEVRAMRGRSSATTTHVRMHDRSTERCFSWGTELPRPLVHSSITPARGAEKERHECDLELSTYPHPSCKINYPSFNVQLTIRAEGVPDFVLRDGGEPDCGVELDLGGRDEYRVVAGVDRAEAPEGEPQAAIGIKAESHVPGGIQLTLQLHRPVGIM